MLEFKNWIMYGVCSFVTLGGYLTARGLTVEKTVIAADQGIDKAASAVKKVNDARKTTLK